MEGQAGAAVVEVEAGQVSYSGQAPGAFCRQVTAFVTEYSATKAATTTAA